MKEQVYLLEQFDDIKILRYDVPAFEGLSSREKLFVYYLSRAALAGRDILWDQNNKYNLRVRAALESILRAYQGNRETEEFQAFLVYAKKVFFANGIHHHYSMEQLQTFLNLVGLGQLPCLPTVLPLPERLTCQLRKFSSTLVRLEVYPQPYRSLP